MGQYDRVWWGGQQITRRQRQAMKAVEKAIREKHPKNHGDFEFIVPQGSWEDHTEYSGWTHTKAGALDVFFENMSNPEWFNEVLRMTRRVGHQGAFGRGPWCKMPYHLHVLDLDTNRMHTDAKWQVDEYRRGNDGLVGGRKDPFPYRPRPLTEWKFKN